MKVAGRTVLITGAASGIGAAMAARFAAEGAKAMALGDLNTAALERLAQELALRHGVEVVPLHCDVAVERSVRAFVDEAVRRFGGVDLYCSNAGLVIDGDENTPDEVWTLNWNVHVMASVWAARAVVPQMLERGEGYFLITASAAGLLSSIPSTTYAVTKHAAIALAEKLAIDHGDRGLRVSVLCPQAVDTPLMQGRLGKGAALDGVATADEVADCVVRGLADETFLILPHPQVRDYFGKKAADYDRWLSGMRRGRARILAAQ